MRRHRKTLILAGAVLTASLAGLGASAGAAAAASTPVIIQTPDYFVCNSNGICSPGPGDVGVAYEADIFPAGGANETGPWTVSLASGSLPPGLQLSFLSGDAYQITGTPTAAGTYDFTLKVVNQAGGSGTTQLFITVGTGTADHLVGISATYPTPADAESRLDVEVWDANAGATYTMYVTSTGKEIGTMTEVGGMHVGSVTISPDPQNVTIKDSLGGSVSVPVTLRVVHKY